MTFIDFVQAQLKQGRSCFTLAQAQQELGKTRKAVLSSIEHLVAKKGLVSPARGFYVILSPEYQALGCLPAEQFITALMHYWKEPFYVGLLTAASYHGASHQAPQTFQVMMQRHKNPLRCGRVHINFITNRHLEKTPTQMIETPRGRLIVSTPEGTVMDLLKYPLPGGGLNTTLTILEALSPTLSPAKLRALLEHQPEIAWKQRLGYMLEVIQANALVRVVDAHLKQCAREDYVPLASGVTLQNASRNKKWKIIENTTLESDL